MKSPAFASLFALLLTTGPDLLVAAPGTLLAESILPEGSLEKANAAGTGPAGWGSARNVTWIVEEGNHFFRVAADPGKQTGLYVSAPVTIGVKALELSFRARVTGLAVGEQNYFDARVIINFKDDAGKRTPPPKLPYFNKDTDGWITVTQRMLVPETATSVELMPGFFKADAGTFDFDDITMKPIDPSQVK